MCNTWKVLQIWENIVVLAIFSSVQDYITSNSEYNLEAFNITIKSSNLSFYALKQM